MDTLETRSFGVSELRAVKDKLMIAGHAAMFHRLSEDLGGFREQIMPGAFAQSLMDDDIKGRYNHEVMLGRNRSGTLQLAEDAVGLAFELQAVDSAWGRHVFALVERGDVAGGSFAFRVPPGGDQWEPMPDVQCQLRTLLCVRLSDIAIVDDPAYLSTDVGVAKRSLDLWRASLAPPAPPYQRFLRERRQRLLELAP